ncbi:sporulation phosphorelay system protein KapB [Alteribacillus iranensis]|uniref:Kinase-associated protein B n=1 Tax=Alteribacillus iranensis TaxID=930128 RepID=A0A1I1ZXY7_9BACI|nr:sporulation phosphorelay system protein KapB [Alteribacillus iranensis]SFE35563.1 kinase-associated protein B [Alteribacillus iranensis]
MKKVQAPYKSGIYIGEPMEEKGDKTLIKVLAVSKHPNQGDLHHPKSTDVPLFHERKALAENEKVWVPTALAQEYEGEVPDYKASLREALDRLEEKLKNEQNEYGEKALKNIETLKQDYHL